VLKAAVHQQAATVQLVAPALLTGAQGRTRGSGNLLKLMKQLKERQLSFSEWTERSDFPSVSGQTLE